MAKAKQSSATNNKTARSKREQTASPLSVVEMTDSDPAAPADLVNAALAGKVEIRFKDRDAVISRVDKVSLAAYENAVETGLLVEELGMEASAREAYYQHCLRTTRVFVQMYLLDDDITNCSADCNHWALRWVSPGEYHFTVRALASAAGFGFSYTESISTDKDTVKISRLSRSDALTIANALTATLSREEAMWSPKGRSAAA